MKDSAVSKAPFEVGERIAPLQLLGWDYVGLSGIPDQPHASRRYIKGMWGLELNALSNKKRPARILSLRTESEDRRWWTERSTQLQSCS